jgi:DNA-directed RNA polymerase subunit H (RpoH/RPB5)
MSYIETDSIITLTVSTLREMMKDRGMEEKKSEWPTLLFSKGKDDTLVYYLTNKKSLTKSDLEEFNKKVGYTVKEKNFTIYKNVILIYPDQEGRNGIAPYLSDYIINPYFESFTFKQLTFNVSRHIDTPTVTLIEEKDEEKLLKELGLKRNQLTIVSQNDALMSYYHIRNGSIIKCERYCPLNCLAPYTISYHLVV